jgi:hypothetical protein
MVSANCRLAAVGRSSPRSKSRSPTCRARSARAVRYDRQLLHDLGPTGMCQITIGAGARSLGCTQIQLLPLLYLDAGSEGISQNTNTILLVPNKVATVTARYSAQNAPRAHAAVTITKPVVDNFVVFHFTGAWDPPTLSYRLASGALISYSPAPHPATGVPTVTTSSTTPLPTTIPYPQPTTVGAPATTPTTTVP